MVIQRWQSVLLFLAGLSMCLFAFLPLCDIIDKDILTIVKPINVLPVFIVSLLTGLLLFIAVFLFRVTHLQKQLSLAGIILNICVCAATVLYICNIDAQLGIIWNWSLCLPPVALVLTIWAIARIRHDENILKSYDRIR